MKFNLCLFISAALLTVLLFATFTVFAQDGGTPSTDPAISPWSLAIGTGISLAVTFLKRIPFVGSNPKIVATVLSVAVTVIQAIAGARAGAGVLPFVLTVLTQLATAIGTHEVALKATQS